MTTSTTPKKTTQTSKKSKKTIEEKTNTNPTYREKMDLDTKYINYCILTVIIAF